MSNPFKKNSDDDKIEEQIATAVGEADVVAREDEKSKAKEEDKKDKENAKTADNPSDGPKNPADNGLQEKYDTLNNQYIRLAADFDNYRKRQAQERESLLKYGAENILKKLLEVLDNFDRGEKANEKIDDCEKVKESFNLVHKQLINVLKKAGLEEIDAKGQEFDPNFHEAVMQTPTNDYPEHTIIEELQKGYKMGDRVLRAALVNVATKAE